MRKWIDLFEDAAWPQTIAGWELAKRVQDIHHTPEDFQDGDLYDNIASYDVYHLCRVPLDSLNLQLFTIHDDLVNDYAAMDGNAPPIIVDGQHTHVIIDGNHRANAAQKRGEHDILAYVGDPSTYSAPDRDEDDEDYDGREKGW